MPITVLIADDEADFRELVKRALGGAVDVVAEASEGEEAVQLAADLTPDVVLLDLDIPGLDGIAAAWKIKTVRSATKVILLTAHDEEAYLAFTGKTGADAVLRKQDLRMDLLSRIRSLVGPRGRAWDGRERRGGTTGGPSRWGGRERRRKPWVKKVGDETPPGAGGS